MAATGLTKAEQSQKTRRALLDTARGLFTTQGYATTATEEIVRRAGASVMVAPVSAATKGIRSDSKKVT